MFCRRPFAFPTGSRMPWGNGFEAVDSPGVMPSTLASTLVTAVYPYVPVSEAPVPAGIAYGAQNTAKPPRMTVEAFRE